MSFEDSFWSPGYHEGVDALFNKLSQGIVENSEFVSVAAARADIEELYGAKLEALNSSFKPKKAGFARDDGASMRRAYEGILDEMSKEGIHHLKVATNIRRMVVTPFSKWSNEHKNRVTYSREALTKKLKQYERELSEVHKAQKRYFNKCRVLEDFKDTEHAHMRSDEENGDGSPRGVGGEEVKLTDTTAPEPKGNGHPELRAASIDRTDSPHSASPSAREPDLITSEELVLAGKVYDSDYAQLLVASMLKEIPQKTSKVAILGSYDHVSTGADITSWIQENIRKENGQPLGVVGAESVGQDLVKLGFLRLIGQVGSKFANSSVMQYQWRPKAFEFAGFGHAETSGLDLIAGTFGETISETWTGYLGRGNHGNDDKLGDQLTKEVRELDQKYRKNVGVLDKVRTELEEMIVEHFRFMQRCEFDRLKALKAVTLDFSAALSNVVPTIQASVDKLLLFQETMNPANDLRYIIEAYRTGPFVPSVTVYDNYYSSAEGNIFGMDLELRSRGDRKHVPYIVSAILSHLDQVYPRLEDDAVRLSLWTVNVPLKSTHALRRELNGNTAFDKEILSRYDPPVVVSVLKLYLLELPDSVIPGQYYGIFKAVYEKVKIAGSSSSGSGYDRDSTKESRYSAIQNILVQLRVANIATLDALTAHLKRLTTIAKSDEPTLENIAKEVSACILHPKQQNALTLEDDFPTRLFRDLLDDRDRIFKQLKQAAQQPRPMPADSVRRRESVENRVSRIAQRLASSQLSFSTLAENREGEINAPAAENENSAGHESMTEVPPSMPGGLVFGETLNVDTAAARQRSVSVSSTEYHSPGEGNTVIPGELNRG